MKDTYLQKNRLNTGNTFFTALVFIFTLIGTLRICCNKTLHEAKLTGIFIQETQGYYLLENLMALARDYAYQITQNPREPNIFLSASAYRKKDKTYQASKGEKNAWVIDFNSSLSKEQIVPGNFPLQIADDGWDIKGGPIFWQDKKKDEDDERYLAEIFMLGTLKFSSALISDWTMHMVQTMEIEHNPLCDFQLYAEGDTSLTGNISCFDSGWYINFYGPVQINGNARFPRYMGYSDNNKMYFYNKFNIAGNALSVYSNYKSIKLPSKYHIQDNSDFYDNFTNPYSTGTSYHYINKYAINYTSQSTLSINSNGSSNNYTDTKSPDFEHYAFKTWQGNFSTRSRVYRPCGFDPGNYSVWWNTKTQAGNSPTAGDGVDKGLLTLDFCLGMHNLAKTSAVTSHYLYSKKFTNYNPFSHIKTLRGLTDYQITEKARLVETQKAINGPCLEVRPLTNNSASLSVNVNVPYTTYDFETYFPAKYDNTYVKRYLTLREKSKSSRKLKLDSFYICTTQSTAYSFPSTSNASSDTPNIESDGYYQTLINNKLAYNKQTGTETSNLENIFKLKSTFSPTSYSDTSCPPHKLIDCGDHWELDTNQTRIKSSEAYQFLYDRNRAKWIQILDFDVAALKDAIGTTITSTQWKNMNRTIKFNAYWQGMVYNGSRNYTINNNDIRYNFLTNRTSFFNTYLSALSFSQNFNVIDVGVRIINAQELPEGGLTIFSPYPIYLQGNFNTVNTKPKACIISDSITVLSDKKNNSDGKYWSDWSSSLDYFNSYLISSDKDNVKGRKPPTIYAHIMTGRTHPNFWLKNDRNINPDLGIHDAIRTLEDFTEPIKLCGSILLPYYCQEQWEPPINFCHYARKPNSYAPINWYLGNGSEWGKMRTAPGLPFYHRINRGRKTQTIGESSYNTLIGTTLYDKDWDSTSYTFSTYHSALPNYLKYETAP